MHRCRQSGSLIQEAIITDDDPQIAMIAGFAKRYAIAANTLQRVDCIKGSVAIPRIDRRSRAFRKFDGSPRRLNRMDSPGDKHL